MNANKSYQFYGNTYDEWMKLAKSEAEASDKFLNEEAIENFRSRGAALEFEERYENMAQIAMNEGIIEDEALFDLDGKYIEAKRVETRYGYSWVTEEGVWYNPSNAKKLATRKRNDRLNGFELGRAEFKARAYECKVYHLPEDFISRVIVDEDIIKKNELVEEVLDKLFQYDLIRIDSKPNFIVPDDKLFELIEDNFKLESVTKYKEGSSVYNIYEVKHDEFKREDILLGKVIN